MPPMERNLARAVFGDGEAHQYLRPSISENSADYFESAIVADLRTATITYPTDPGLRSLVRGLLKTNSTFEQHWQRVEVGHHTTDRKTVSHPDVGTITLDCDVLTAPGSDLRLILYSAPAGSADAEKLDFLRVTQHVSTPHQAGAGEPVTQQPHSKGM